MEYKGAKTITTRKIKFAIIRKNEHLLRIEKSG